jgi:NAD(P)-dependent dehydrogenase (short-subunit alcohol dehydrogenase family)
MTQPRRMVVLITGASSGLGLALGKLLHEAGRYHLILTSRSTSSPRFAEAGIVAQEHLWLRDLDITDYAQMRRVIAEVEATLGGVDILVNNAGITERSTVEESGDLSRHRQLDVNYLAPFELIARILPLMRKKHFGRIINISSAGGFMAMPTMSGYSASKFALEAASESLWYEMKPWGIRITLIVPGFINSEGYLNTTETPKGKLGARDESSAYFEHYRGMRTLIANSMQSVKATNESIALRIASVLRRGHPPLRVHITTEALVFFWVRKLLPATFYHWVVYRFLPNVQSWGLNRFRHT